MKTVKFIQNNVIYLYHYQEKKKKHNTMQTLMKRISTVTENFGTLLNHFFQKKLNQEKVLH